jgi:fructokinase
MRVLTLGEVLWDVIRDQEFLGGAPLNFSVSLHRLGHDVTFASGVGADERGNRALRAVHHLGLSTKFIRINRQLPTGTAVVLENPAGNATFRIDRPAAFDVGDDDPALLSRLEQSQPDWIYFGTLAQTSPEGEARLFRITDAVPQARCFYDMNLRQGHWNLELVRRLSRRATILKLNDGEAEILSQLSGLATPSSIAQFCRFWSENYGPKLICVTLGGRGCAVWSHGTLHESPGFAVEVADTIGAGDAFAAAFLHGMSARWPLERVASFANALGAIVAGRPGATPQWQPEECLQLRESSPAAIARPADE